MTRSDAALIALLAAIALLAWPASLLASGSGDDVATITGPGGTTVVPLNADHTLDIAGRIGTLRVRTGPEGVRVLSADCPDGICKAQGLVSSPGAAVVCAPNGVSVRIGGGEGAPDATVR